MLSSDIFLLWKTFSDLLNDTASWCLYLTLSSTSIKFHPSLLVWQCSHSRKRGKIDPRMTAQLLRSWGFSRGEICFEADPVLAFVDCSLLPGYYLVSTVKWTQTCDMGLNAPFCGKTWEISFSLLNTELLTDSSGESGQFGIFQKDDNSKRRYQRPKSKLINEHAQGSHRLNKLASSVDAIAFSNLKTFLIHWPN